MDDPKYDGLLYGDISAIAAHRRVQYLPKLLDRTDLHHRLIYGTDYPVPAVWVVVWTSTLVRYGLITAEQRTILDQIYKHNALLFDFVLKRCLKSPKTGAKFKDCVFQMPAFLKPVIPPIGAAVAAAAPVPAAVAPETAAGVAVSAKKADDPKAQSNAEVGIAATAAVVESLKADEKTIKQ
jgi:hypothetical protein